MASDLLEVAMRNKEFVEDCMANPDISNSAAAIIDRFILICGKDILDLRLDGPNMVGNGSEFDVCWTLKVKEA